jgi:hypothetical protein
MATTIRKRFELDLNLLKDININADTVDAETLKEVRRSLKLNRQYTKF